MFPQVTVRTRVEKNEIKNAQPAFIVILGKNNKSPDILFLKRKKSLVSKSMD